MKAFKLLSLLYLLCSATTLLADQNSESLESYISKNKQEQFSYDYEKNEAESSKLRDSWIAPLNLQYSYSRSNPYGDEQTSQNAAIKMDQTIFQSGGIYYAIKYAEASHRYMDLSVDVLKRKLIKDAISLLMQIKQMELKIAKQNLQIKNAEINLQLKKEQYLNGQLDSGFLDNAVIERNNVIQALYDMQTSKERLLSQFQTISDVNYKSVRTPHLEYIDEEDFLRDNIVLKMSKSDIEKNRYNKDVVTAKYLPRLSITAGYNWNKSENYKYVFGANEKDYYDYGFKAYMPLDINTFKDIESSKVTYLKAELALEDKKRELRALYDQVMQNIDNYDKKITLCIENRDIYDKLLEDTRDLYDAGYKTHYDVELLENSLKMQEIDAQVFEIDKQRELLTLYEMYKNGK